MLRIERPLRRYLEECSDIEGKTMVRIIEEMLHFRSQFKTWPPDGKTWMAPVNGGAK